MDYEQLKKICKAACHDRNACKNGFEALLRANSTEEILAVWKANWDDIYRSKFSDIMAAHIADVYSSLRQDFVRNNVFVNENTEHGLLIVSNPSCKIMVGGNAKAYLFTAADIEAYDNAQVYNRTDGSNVLLRGHAHGCFENGNIVAKEFSYVKGKFSVCHCHDAADIVCMDGTVIDHGHRRISAYLGSKIYSDISRSIEISGQARLYPLCDYYNEK